MSSPLVVRLLFVALLLFWFVGVVLLLVQRPHNCLFYNRPHSGGKTTPANPHDDPSADTFYHLTHVLTLLPWSIWSVLTQLLGFLIWFGQLMAHPYLEHRISRESRRRREESLRGSGGCCACCKRVIFDEREIEAMEAPDEVSMDSDQTHTADSSGGGATNVQHHHHKQITVAPSSPSRSPRRYRSSHPCRCGCHVCFSTNCTVWLVDLLMLLTSCYMVLIGYGAVEGANRYTQNNGCRRGVSAGIYLLVVHAAVGIMFIVLCLLRCCCTPHSIVTDAVHLTRKVRAKLRAKRAARKAQSLERKKNKSKQKTAAGGRSGSTAKSSSVYTQVGGQADDGLGIELQLDPQYAYDEDDVDVDDDDNPAFAEDEEEEDGDGFMEVDVAEDEDDDGLGMEEYEFDEDDGEYDEYKFHATTKHGSHRGGGGSSQLHQPKPQRPTQSHLINQPPSAAATTSSSSSSAYQTDLQQHHHGGSVAAPAELDEDMREQLEMLERRVVEPDDEQDEGQAEGEDGKAANEQHQQHHRNMMMMPSQFIYKDASREMDPSPQLNLSDEPVDVKYIDANDDEEEDMHRL